MFEIGILLEWKMVNRMAALYLFYFRRNHIVHICLTFKVKGKRCTLLATKGWIITFIKKVHSIQDHVWETKLNIMSFRSADSAHLSEKYNYIKLHGAWRVCSNCNCILLCQEIFDGIRPRSRPYQLLYNDRACAQSTTISPVRIYFGCISNIYILLPAGNFGRCAD